MTVSEMLFKISSREIVEWMAYLSVQSEPEQEVKTSDVLKAMFPNRVKKKAK
jgi:hypothetical protein